VHGYYERIYANVTADLTTWTKIIVDTQNWEVYSGTISALIKNDSGYMIGVNADKGKIASAQSPEHLDFQNYNKADFNIYRTIDIQNYSEVLFENNFFQPAGYYEAICFIPLNRIEKTMDVPTRLIHEKTINHLRF